MSDTPASGGSESDSIDICENLAVLSSFVRVNKKVLLKWFDRGGDESEWKLVHARLHGQSKKQLRLLRRVLGVENACAATWNAAELTARIRDGESEDDPIDQEPAIPHNVAGRMGELAAILKDRTLQMHLRRALRAIQKMDAGQEESILGNHNPLNPPIPAILRAQKLFREANPLDAYMTLVDLAENMLPKNM